jgi:predicted DNA-binding antitoxin AbrB/MazE fold protein
MLDLITAIYENGVLRPITPLALPEHSRVQIQIQASPVVESPAEHRRRVHEVLVAAGLSLPRPPDLPEAKPLSAERREELAYILAASGSLSEVIIAEREEADDRLLRR